MNTGYTTPTDGAKSELDVIRALPLKSDERKRAVKEFLDSHPRIRQRTAHRAMVDSSMVSKVLHGAAISEPVVTALLAEMSLSEAPE